MEDLAVGTRVKHAVYGEGIVSRSHLTIFEIFFERGGKMELTKYNTELEILSTPSEEKPRSGLSLIEVEKVIALVLDKYQGITYDAKMADKWKGGTLEMKPANPELQSKDIPMETFFHKIVMLRDRLRVLEQNINTHEKLDDQDKVQLQQYITRAYGSLTTFNVLFAEKDDYFKGQSK
ncbi:hypothetical protein [Mangrovibacterium diazotrophicum]|uniref:Uncharacterized protein n=1 Tax=Mangrovibacterium diazotrophicum TaxID=1261403 RepID=A0A419W7R7_9BACT|nr:hypothetical protein [Mangrovibacterium diazotrophicum]RKD91513.1 hypothetical protein BC643_1869 [Mangrovibacterium diazotrophicum]